MRNILDVLEKKEFLYIAKQRLLCKKILQALVNLEERGKLNTPGKERLLKGSRLVQGFIDICDKASMRECKIALEDLTKKIEVITNGGNTEVGTLKNFFDSLEKYNSVFYVPKGLLSL